MNKEFKNNIDHQTQIDGFSEDVAKTVSQFCSELKVSDIKRRVESILSFDDVMSNYDSYCKVSIAKNSIENKDSALFEKFDALDKSILDSIGQLKHLNDASACNLIQRTHAEVAWMLLENKSEYSANLSKFAAHVGVKRTSVLNPYQGNTVHTGPWALLADFLTTQAENHRGEALESAIVGHFDAAINGGLEALHKLAMDENSKKGKSTVNVRTTTEESLNKSHSIINTRSIGKTGASVLALSAVAVGSVVSPSSASALESSETALQMPFMDVPSIINSQTNFVPTSIQGPEQRSPGDIIRPGPYSPDDAPEPQEIKDDQLPIANSSTQSAQAEIPATSTPNDGEPAQPSVAYSPIIRPPKASSESEKISIPSDQGRYADGVMRPESEGVEEQAIPSDPGNLNTSKEGEIIRPPASQIPQKPDRAPSVIAIPSDPGNDSVNESNVPEAILIESGVWNPNDMPDGKDILAELKKDAVKNGHVDKKGNPESGHLSNEDLEYVNKDIWGNHRLNKYAAEGLRAMNEAYKAKFGENLKFTDSYRSYDIQVETKKKKGNLAATPGSSVHGWGMAVDFSAEMNMHTYRSEQQTWMYENAAKFGFAHPEWAREFNENDTANKQEPWHWEYVGIGALEIDYSKQLKLRAEYDAQAPKSGEKIENVELEAAKRMSTLNGQDGRAGKIIAELIRRTDLTPMQAAGLVGNLLVESPGLDSDKNQNGGGPGRGLAQWEEGGSRYKALEEFAEKNGLKWHDFDTQVDFIIHELMGSENRAYDQIRKTKTVKDAALATRIYYERPGVHHDEKRIDQAEKVFAKYDEIRKAVQSENGGAKTNEKSAAQKNKEKVLAKMAEALQKNQSWDDAKYPVAGDPETTSDIGSRANGYHRGVDFAMPIGDKFYSMFDGVATITEVNTSTPACNALMKQIGGWPRKNDPIQKNVYITSKVGDKLVTIYYGHLSQFDVRNGQTVKAGDIIGESGDTGCSTGPHAHIEASQVDYPDSNITGSNVVGILNNSLDKIVPGVKTGDIVSNFEDKLGKAKSNSRTKPTASEVKPNSEAPIRKAEWVTIVTPAREEKADVKKDNSDFLDPRKNIHSENSQGFLKVKHDTPVVKIEESVAVSEKTDDEIEEQVKSVEPMTNVYDASGEDRNSSTRQDEAVDSISDYDSFVRDYISRADIDAKAEYYIQQALKSAR